MQEIKTGFGTPFLVVWPYILPQEKDYFSPRLQIFSSIFPRISTSQSLAGKFVMVNCIVKLIFYTMKSPILQSVLWYKESPFLFGNSATLPSSLMPSVWSPAYKGSRWTCETVLSQSGCSIPLPALLCSEMGRWPKLY